MTSVRVDERIVQRGSKNFVKWFHSASHQQIHGSKRSLRSVEDFTEFEQRTAYFHGDPIRVRVLRRLLRRFLGRQPCVDFRYRLVSANGGLGIQPLC